jgi:hypothetical protein
VGWGNVPAMIDIYLYNFGTVIYQLGGIYEIPMRKLRISKQKKEKFI